MKRRIIIHPPIYNKGRWYIVTKYKNGVEEINRNSDSLGYLTENECYQTEIRLLIGPANVNDTDVFVRTPDGKYKKYNHYPSDEYFTEMQTFVIKEIAMPIADGIKEKIDKGDFNIDLTLSKREIKWGVDVIEVLFAFRQKYNLDLLDYGWPLRTKVVKDLVEKNIGEV